MKRNLYILLSVILSVTLCVSLLSPVSAYDSKAVANDKFTSAVKDAHKGVLESRFLNMLNHNQVYNSDFESVEAIINDSVISQLGLREEGSDYIAEAHIKSFVYNMYGVLIDDFSQYNKDFPQRQGFVYIIPRGYSLYKHTLVSINENEDGTYTVVTSVSVQNHDSEEDTIKAISLFAENKDSQFGYNIIYSDLTDNAF